MTTRETVPREYYSPHPSPKKIITQPIRQTKPGAAFSIVANLGSIDQVPSTSRSRRESNQSKKRNRSLAAANASTCCKCALATTMVLLTASLIATIFVPFLLVRSEVDDSTVTPSIASSLSYSTVPGISTNTSLGTLPISVSFSSSLTSVTSITNNSLGPTTISSNSAASSGSTTNVMIVSSASSTSLASSASPTLPASSTSLASSASPTLPASSTSLASSASPTLFTSPASSTSLASSASSTSSASSVSASTTITETTSSTPLMTSTTMICGTPATACTGCTSSCSPGLILSLTQASSSAWTSGGNGYTTYRFIWLAPAATSAAIQFQFYTTTSGNYWDLDSISVKDSSGTEAITNGGFSSKSSWTETCGIGSCASIQNYGAGSTPMYWVNCISSSNYYSVSQIFPTVPCASYNISFAISRYKGSTNIANAFVYVY